MFKVISTHPEFLPQAENTTMLIKGVFEDYLSLLKNKPNQSIEINFLVTFSSLLRTFVKYEKTSLFSQEPTHNSIHLFCIKHFNLDEDPDRFTEYPLKEATKDPMNNMANCADVLALLLMTEKIQLVLDQPSFSNFPQAAPSFFRSIKHTTFWDLQKTNFFEIFKSALPHLETHLVPEEVKRVTNTSLSFVKFYLMSFYEELKKSLDTIRKMEANKIPIFTYYDKIKSVLNVVKEYKTILGVIPFQYKSEFQEIERSYDKLFSQNDFCVKPEDCLAYYNSLIKLNNSFCDLLKLKPMRHSSLLIKRLYEEYQNSYVDFLTKNKNSPFANEYSMLYLEKLRPEKLKIQTLQIPDYPFNVA